MLPTIKDFIQAGYSCLFLPTIEPDLAEKRVLQALSELGRYKTDFAVWKLTTGLLVHTGGTWQDEKMKVTRREARELVASIKYVEDRVEPIVAVFHNLRFHIKTEEMVRQAIIDAAYKARTKKSVMVFVGSHLELPPELYNVITYCECPLPTKGQLFDQFNTLIGHYESKIKSIPKNKKKRKELINNAANAAMGMDSLSAENAIALSLAMTGGVDPLLIQSQKEQEIKKSDVLEYIATTEGLDYIGGFKELKTWLERRRLAFTDEARDYGLPYPKGILLVGVAGAGKSYCAKAIAVSLGLPLLRLDFGKVYRSLVGDSEQAITRALHVAEAVSPCVLLVDEIDKSLAGHQSSGELDSGVTARVISILLTWRQETKYPVFMVGTANNPEALPSMIMRRGRLDEIWAVDLPTPEEREEIFEIHIRKRGRDPLHYDIKILANESGGFTGAEIESCIEDAMFSAFADGVEFSSAQIFDSINNTIPQNVRDAEEIQKLREWTKNRARSVSGGNT